jgi:hypothetical protein
MSSWLHKYLIDNNIFSYLGFPCNFRKNSLKRITSSTTSLVCITTTIFSYLGFPCNFRKNSLKRITSSTTSFVCITTTIFSYLGFPCNFRKNSIKRITSSSTTLLVLQQQQFFLIWVFQCNFRKNSIKRTTASTLPSHRFLVDDATSMTSSSHAVKISCKKVSGSTFFLVQMQEGGCLSESNLEFGLCCCC